MLEPYGCLDTLESVNITIAIELNGKYTHSVYPIIGLVHVSTNARVYVGLIYCDESVTP